MQLNIAIFIDAENFQGKLNSNLFALVEYFGSIKEKIAYADWSLPCYSPYKHYSPLFGIKLHQRFHDGPDAVDKLIMQEALELAKTRADIDCICILANDHIYAELREQLHSLGKRLMIMGNKAIASILRNDADILLTVFPPSLADFAADSCLGTLAGKYGNAKNTLLAIYEHEYNARGSVSLVEFGQRLKREYPDFNMQDLGYKSLTKLLMTYSDVFFLKSAANRNSTTVERVEC
jgi:hypothetical protein